MQKLILILLALLVVSCNSKIPDKITDNSDPIDAKLHVDEFVQKDEPKGSIEAIRINLDETYQTIHHFGASDAWSAEWVGKWPVPSKEPIAKLLFSSEVDDEGNPEGIAFSMWRFNLGDGAADQDYSGYRAAAWKNETESFLNPDGSYDWSKKAGARWFLRKAKEYGVPYYTGWTNSPPYFMTKNGYTFRTSDVKGYNLAPEYYERFAKYLATVAKHFQDIGYPFTVVSPFNEPQWKWKFTVGDAKQSGSYATNKEIADVTKIINSEFEEMGVSSKIMIPEAAHLDYLYEYKGNRATSDQINFFFNTESPNYIGDLSNLSKYVAGHSYGLNANVETSVKHRQNLLSRLRNMDRVLEFWQTEYSLLGADYRQGKKWTELKPMDYALWLARVVHIDLTQANCSGWSFWIAMNNSTYQDHLNRFGLIFWNPNIDGPDQSDGTYKVTKNLWALGNYSRFVRPGMVRVAVDNKTTSTPEQQAGKLMVSAYTDRPEGKLVLVFTNYSEVSKRINVTNLGQDFSIEGDFKSYTTSAIQDLEYGTMSTNNIKISEQSIVTLVANLK